VSAVEHFSSVAQLWAILFALLTALSNALALTTQHLASARSRESLRGWRLWRFLMHQPLWFVGWLALLGSLVFQSFALHFGPLSLVQPILVTELILGLALRQTWLHQRVQRAAWTGALATVAGLAIFLLVASPKVGLATPSTSRSLIAIAVVCVVTLVLVASARDASPTRRAGALATVTGLLWAFEAMFIKATTDTLTSGGIEGALRHWPLYAFVGGGIAGLLSEQAALHAGPLRVSQPLIVIIDPLASVTLGLWLFDEHVRAGPLAASLAALGLVIMSWGVVALTRNAPESMAPHR